jgi:hypothetical protein
MARQAMAKRLNQEATNLLTPTNPTTAFFLLPFHKDMSVMQRVWR